MRIFVAPLALRLMRCFTFEKVLLFCPQVSEDIAFKYMLQLTNGVVFPHFVVGVRRRPPLLGGREGSGWKRSPIKAKHGADAACDCHDSGVMFGFFFFILFCFFFLLLLRGRGEYSQLSFGIQGKSSAASPLLVRSSSSSSCVRKQSA